MIYEYMIVYQYEEGCGRVFLERNLTIESDKDIERIDKQLEDMTGHKSVIVTDFKLLRSYESESK